MIPKLPTNVFVRVPSWAPTESVRLSMDGGHEPVRMIGDYAYLPGVGAFQEIRLEHALPVRCTTETTEGIEFEFAWKATKSPASALTPASYRSIRHSTGTTGCMSTPPQAKGCRRWISNVIEKLGTGGGLTRSHNRRLRPRGTGESTPAAGDRFVTRLGLRLGAPEPQHAPGRLQATPSPAGAPSLLHCRTLPSPP